jgi:hypothetical protein
VKFACDRYPQLSLVMRDDGGYRTIKFTDGTATVPDEDTAGIAAARAHPDIRAVGGRPKK